MMFVWHLVGHPASKTCSETISRDFQLSVYLQRLFKRSVSNHIIAGKKNS